MQHHYLFIERYLPSSLFIDRSPHSSLTLDIKEFILALLVFITLSSRHALLDSRSWRLTNQTNWKCLLNINRLYENVLVSLLLSRDSICNYLVMPIYFLYWWFWVHFLFGRSRRRGFVMWFVILFFILYHIPGSISGTVLQITYSRLFIFSRHCWRSCEVSVFGIYCMQRPYIFFLWLSFCAAPPNSILYCIIGYLNLYWNRTTC